MTLATFLLFTALVAVATWLLTRGQDHTTNDGYFLAGRSLGCVTIAGSLLLTNLSTEQLVGLNGLAYKDGLSVMAWEVMTGVVLVLMALFFLPRYLKGGITTIPQFLEDRYGPTTRTITTVVFIAAYALILLPIVLYTGAVALIGMLDVSSITGLENPTANLWIMVVLIGGVGSLYAIIGGLKTVAVSDTINGALLLVGGMMIVVFGLSHVAEPTGGGGPIKGLTTLYNEHPEMFESLGRSDQAVPWHTLFTGVFLLPLFYWTTNQQIIQRTFGARNLAEGQKGVLLAAGLKVLAPLIVVLPGIIAFHLYAESGLSGDASYGVLVRDVLPGYLTGFFAAAVVGAVLSSFNSALNSVATLFSLGIYRGVLHPGASQKQTVTAGVVCGSVVALFAVLAAPFLAEAGAIFSYLQEMNAIYFIPILTVVLVGMLDKRGSEATALITLAVSLGLMLLGSFVIKGWITDAESGLGMNFFHYVGIVFVVSVALHWGLGFVFPRATPYAQQDVGAVDLTPWRHAKWVSALVIVAVAAVYVAFAF